MGGSAVEDPQWTLHDTGSTADDPRRTDRGRDGMGLFGSAERTAAREAKEAAQAERKAAKQVAKAVRVAKYEAEERAQEEARVARIDAARAEKTLLKDEKKARKKAAKVERKAEKKTEKAVDGAVKALTEAGTIVHTSTIDLAEAVGVQQGFDAKKAKRLIGVARKLAPIVAPTALGAATTVRAVWDARRAAQLGVAPEQLSRFTGPGGTLKARLAHVSAALDSLDSGSPTSAATPSRAYVEATKPRIADLSVAVRTAEQMPAARRRTALRAIGNELDTVESQLLDHLGVPS